MATGARELSPKLDKPVRFSVSYHAVDINRGYYTVQDRQTGKQYFAMYHIGIVEVEADKD